MVILQWLILLAVLRMLGTVQLRLGPDKGALITADGLPVGAPVPRMDHEAVSGAGRVTLPVHGRNTILFFGSSTCTSCKQIYPALNRIRGEIGETQIIVVLLNSPRVAAALARQHSLRMPVLADEDRKITEAYQVAGVPFAYLINGEGRVERRGVVNFADHLVDLVTGHVREQSDLSWTASND